MDRNDKIIIIAGIAICLALTLINVYIGAIAFVILIILFMSLRIMQDTKTLVDIAVVLSDNAKSISIINRGNLPVKNIVVALVPLNREFKITCLAVDEKVTYPLEEMLREAKAVASYEIENGTVYQKTFSLGGLRNGDEDILKPMFPIFGWK